MVRVQARVVDYEVSPQTDEDVFCNYAVFELRAN